MVKEGTHIILTVSTAKPTSNVPKLTGGTYEDAVKALVADGVDQSRISQDPRFSEDFPEGQVIGSEPAEGSEYDPDTASFVIFVSKGQESKPMPDLTNKTQKEAKAILEEMGLVLDEVSEDTSYSIEKGKITKQWPYEQGDLVSPGDKISVSLSTGYPPEALNYTFNVPVAPSSEGKKTKIRIVYSDARNNGEPQEWGTRTIAKTQVLSVNLVLAPNKDGAVSIYQDGEYIEAFEVRYSDAKNGTVQQPEPPATQTPEPTVAPTQAPPEPTIEPEILPPDSGEGENTGEVDQTGFLTEEAVHGKQAGNGKGNGNGNNKDKSKVH
ncbi:Serine/threonine-protein kinase PrkC [compost metagenome]